MVALYVREDPHVAGILAEGVTRKLTLVFPVICPLAWILLRYAEWVEVENVIIALCVPQHSFVTTAKPFPAMEPMLEVPDEPIAKPQSINGGMLLKDRMNENV